MLDVIPAEKVVRPSFQPKLSPMEHKREIIYAYFVRRDPCKPLYTPEINHILKLAGATEGEFDCSEMAAKTKPTCSVSYIGNVSHIQPKDLK